MIRKTKIICTIGPSSGDVDALVKLIECGMNVARLNFSHGTHEDHARYMENIRTASRLTKTPIAIIQDLQGPKIRTGKLKNGEVPLRDGAEFIITTDEIEGDQTRVSTMYENLPKDVSPGKTLLLDDGYITLRVERIEDRNIITRVVEGGVLKNHKGIIAPGCVISAASLTEKDLHDLQFGLEHDVDYVALSFVQSERDILELKTAMKTLGRVVPVIAKIERFEAFSDIEDIIHEAEAIMVARGDLGVEMNVEDVPVLQKKIIQRCNFYGKAVITATQMLESMIENSRPTRAEASDVANAVFDGTDAVMLSAETSVGKYPFDAVRVMDAVIRKAEADQQSKPPVYDVPDGQKENVADAIGRACCVMAEQIHAAAIMPMTTSGGTAKIIAKYRPTTPIIALTDHVETQRILSLVWGIHTLLVPPLVDTDSTLNSIHPIVIESGLVKKDDYVVYTAGIPLQIRTSTNMLKVEQL